MTYLALLRGINVGGNNTVPMQQLKEAFVALGCKDVRTYINSGNVLFSSTSTPTELQSAIEDMLERTFGFTIKVLVVDKATLGRIAGALPSDWRNDKTMKCDIIFLWAAKNTPHVIVEVTVVPGIDSVTYVDGALLWSAPRSQVIKSGLLKLAGTNLYKQMTIRNCNTVRKLIQLSEL